MEQARILIVEDESIIAMEMEQRLSQLGHEVAGVASNMERALELAAEQAPNLALLDIHIQGAADGIATAEALMSRHDIPVIFLTAFADEATLTRARAARPYGYLVKPWRERELAAAIEFALYRHRAEQELRRAKERFERVVGNIREGLIIDDLEGRVVFANDAFLRLFGLGPADLGALRLEDYVAPEWRPMLREMHERRVRGEAVPVEFEYEGLRKDGSRLWLSVTVAPVFEQGKVSGTQSALRDITAAKQLQDALARREHQLAEAQRLARIGSWVRDLETEEVEISLELAEVFGLPEDQRLGPASQFFAMVHPEDIEALNALAAEVVAGRGPLDGEFRLFRPDGSLLYLHTRAELQVDAAGRPARLVGTSQDVTARRLREIEQAQFEHKMQQAQRLESLGVLAGGIAHDFNNILTAIMGNLALARLELDSRPAVGELLGEAEAASQRAAELCRQMLAYSGRGRLMVELVDLSTLVREMTAILDVSVGRQARLRLELAARLPPVEADATQLRQIVMNLITNAMDALGDQPGEIALSTGVERLAGGQRVAFSDAALPEGQYVFIRVADSGHGMDEATLSRIFDPFFSTKFTGRGLGLAAVAGILRSHRGAIKVVSQPGQGSTFTIWLPAAGVEAALPAGEAPADQADPPLRGKVMLVEDSAPVRAMTATMLGRMGLSVRDFPGGAEALASRWSAAPDWAVLDLSMPGMDGFTLLGHLRERYPKLPVVLVSGYTDQELPPQVAGDPRVRFVEKPYKERTLREALQAAGAGR